MGLSATRPADHEGFTVDMAERLVPNGLRFELHGGEIRMMSPAAQWHSLVQRRLAGLLERGGRWAGIEVGMWLGPKETRVLDVAAFRAEIDLDEAYFPPYDIALAVEVVSPSSVDNDYHDKPELYARLGIPEFWRADRREDKTVVVDMFTLDDERRVYLPSRTATLAELEAAATGGT